MSYKNIVSSGLCALLMVSGSCNNPSSDDTTTTTPTTTSKLFGTFLVSLELVDSDRYTSMQGSVNDGPTPENTVWEEAASVGSIHLLTPRIPFCEEACGGGAVCVEDDSCQPYPSVLAAGIVTVNGIKTSDGKTSFTIDTSKTTHLYQPIGLAYPPFAEGDNVSISAAGCGSVPAFTLSTKGISPLVVLNDSIVMTTGQPITLRWTPPTIAGNSTISVTFDISHHGGTKGKIECECTDNGSLEVPASLLDKLKALGVAGFPKVEITRRAVAASTTSNVEFVLESSVTKQITIPGVQSCWNPGEEGECPDGQTCGDKYICQ